ncbi:putative peptidoglycan bound protein, partial [Listeria ivanovii FSL F6-596]
MSKKWKIKQGIRLTSMAFLITGLVISPIHLATTTSQATAATTSKEQNLTSDVAIIALENGDFETPAVPSNRVSQLFNASSVPGWDTTDSSGKIEIQKNGFVPSSKIPAVIAQSGKQWAELNAYENSALYQDVATTPGTKVHWQVYHKGRLGTDVALVEFGEPGGALVEQAKMSDGTTDWGLYKGTYTIPEGQTTTRFQFRAVSSSSGNTGIGNYLDNVQFATASNLQVEGAFSNTSIKVHDSVDYQIQAINNGGMPAANNTFSVQIPAELSYTPGTLSSTDTSITSENYDKSTRTLTFTTGNIKKDASINISIPLTAEKETTAATPDTDVVYNDENFEDETTTAEATDSSTKITSNDAPAITGETNTILQPGETFDPIKTITATDKEDGDLTDKVKITNNPVDTSKSGTYEVSYEVTDSDG